MAENGKPILSDIDYRPNTAEKEKNVLDIPVPILEDLDSRPKTFEEIRAIENGERTAGSRQEYAKMTTRKSGSNVNVTMEQLREELDEKMANQGFKKIIRVCIFGIICALLMSMSGQYNIYHYILVAVASVFIFFKIKAFRTLGIISYLTVVLAGIAYIVFLLIDGFQTDTKYLIQFGCLSVSVILGFSCFFSMFSSQEVKKYFEFRSKEDM